jgi:hypothetical protein
MKGCPLTTDDPASETLLPCSDAEWASGAIAHNGHILSPHLEGVDLGHYARVCQAAHILGRVHRHRAAKDSDKAFQLEEAIQLDRTLRALDASNQQPLDSSTSIHGMQYCYDAIAICCSARFLLYELYACNELYDGNGPTGQEANIQKLALQGIEECVARMYGVALWLGQDLAHGIHAPTLMITHALYWAITEARWYIKEGRQEAVEVSAVMVDVLKSMATRWRIAGELTMSYECCY